MRKYIIVIGDSRKVLKRIKNNSVHLVVTSPPYWFLERYSQQEGDLSRIDDREEFFNELSNVWKECHRILVPGGYLICEFEDIPIGSTIVGFPREICIVGDMVNSIERSGLYLIARLIWKKFKAGAALTKFQYLLYGNLKNGKYDPRFCANFAYVFVFKKEGERKVERDFTESEWKEWADGVWYIENPVSKEESESIAGGSVFPVELIKRLIKIYTKPGDIVLDPFLGTGTTMKAAFELKRKCIGIEVRKEMLPIIKKKVGFGTQDLTEEVKWEVIE
jgi:DNA modification methylase